MSSWSFGFRDDVCARLIAGITVGAMSGSDVAVRQAMIDDAGDIAVVHVATWRATYRGLMPQSLLDGLSVEARTAVWRRILRDDEGSTLVAIEQGAERVVGFVSVGPSRDTDPDRIDGRLDGLRCRVIDPAAQVEIKQTLPVWIQEGRDVSRMRSM